MLARILYGTRISVLFGLMLTLCSSVMGVLAGALQGYYGGKVDLWDNALLKYGRDADAVLIIYFPASYSLTSGGCWQLLSCLAG